MNANITVEFLTQTIACEIVAPLIGGGGGSNILWGDIVDKPSVFPPSSHTHISSDITGLATVAYSGSYSDLLNIPTSFNPSAHTHTASDITSGAFSFNLFPTSGTWNFNNISLTGNSLAINADTVINTTASKTLRIKKPNNNDAYIYDAANDRHKWTTANGTQVGIENFTMSIYTPSQNAISFLGATGLSFQNYSGTVGNYNDYM
ncbi:MAG: hypothetical protein SNJ71_00780, partial [Bacteroidales bacterium]